MYGKGKRIGRKYPLRRMRKRYGKATTKVSQKVRRYVKREIHRNIENKEHVVYAANQSVHVSQGGGQACLKIPLLPPIAVGGTTNQRVGNSIKPRNCHIKGHVNIKEYSVSTNASPGPIWIRMLVVKALNVTYQAGTPGELDSQIFKGNGTGLGWQGNMLDQCMEVNTDLFRKLYDRRFKVGAGYNTGTGPVSSNFYFDNSPMSVPFFINYSKWIKKLLKFNDATNGNSVQNDNLFLLITACTADGNTHTALTPAECHYYNYFKFEDA